jgi:ribose 5-phosphate isomerase B
MSLIGIGSDHAAFAFKEEIKAYLIAKGHRVEDCVTFGPERVDYSDFGFRVAISASTSGPTRGRRG